jgi:hypothetical protein
LISIYWAVPEPGITENETHQITSNHFLLLSSHFLSEDPSPVNSEECGVFWQSRPRVHFLNKT